MGTVTTLARQCTFNFSKLVELTANIAGRNMCAAAFCTAFRRNVCASPSVSRGTAQLRAEWRVRLHVHCPLLSNLRFSQQ
jgi:hypothetical protein